jgi:hypothetical protein
MTLLHPVVDETSKNASAAIRSCYRSEVTAHYAPCDETTTVVDVVDNATGLKPAWLTWDSVNTPDLLTIEPTDNAEAAIYTIKVDIGLVDNVPLEYTTVEITVEVCLLTHFDIPVDPTNPTPVTYTVHALSDLSLDLTTPGFVQ